MHEEPTAYRLEDPGVRALFTESARFQSWLEVEDPHISAHFRPGEITALLDPARHIGLCEQFAEREAGHARAR